METLEKTNMQNNRLLASAALFQCMHASGLDQYDVLAEFIKASVSLSKKHVFSAHECSLELKKFFSCDIPGAVIRRCIQGKLKTSFTLANQFWTRTSSFIPDSQLEVVLHEEQQQQDLLRSKLVSFVEKKKGHTLSESEKSKLTDDFYSYLKNSSVRKDNEPMIAAFTLSLEQEPELNEILRNASYGLLIFEGLRYTATDSPAVLNRDLYLYLDPEVLFNAAGYHGQLYKKIFDDFHDLVKEVNARPSASSGKVYLRYFEDTRQEVESYFNAAQSIVSRRIAPELNRQAMIHIVNGCESSLDVHLKKAQFDALLDKLKITCAAGDNYYEPPDFNVESEVRMHDLAKVLGCPTEKAFQILKQFTKINWLRKGRSNFPLAGIGHLLVSGRTLTKQAAFSDTVKQITKGGFSLATDTDYLTEYFWLKLDKGFSSGVHLPSSFDVITRTRLVLAAHLNEAADRHLKTLKTNKKPVNEAEMRYLVASLRAVKHLPEDLQGTDAEIDFINTADYATQALEEKAFLEHQAEEGQKAQAELGMVRIQSERQRDYYESLIAQALKKNNEGLKAARLRRRDHNKKLIKIVDYFDATAIVMYWIIVALSIGGVITYAITPNDTPLSIMALLVGLPAAVMLATFRKYRNGVKRIASRYLRRRLQRVMLRQQTESGLDIQARVEPSLECK